MELRDQPILDQYQGQVFRLPLDRQLVLLGPPGTGKTTTLIKRLAQKRTEEALTPEELELLDRHHLQDEFRNDTSWVMFSPTDLLKLYVKEAFNREGVPATNYNLRTWSDERRTLGRDVLKFLRANNTGRFTIEEKERFLSDESSPALSKLFDEFCEFFDGELVTRSSKALLWMEESGTDEAQRLARQIRSRVGGRPLSVGTLHELNDHADILQSSLASLRTRIQLESRQIANALLTPDVNARLSELAALLGGTADDETDDEDEEDEDLEEQRDVGSETARMARRLMKLIRSLGRERATGRHSGRRRASVRLASWFGERKIDENSLREIGERFNLKRV